MISQPALIPVFGHAWAQRLLQSAVLSGRASHAYLFAGPDQIGKTTLARAFAQALTCHSPRPAENGLGACGQCRSCRLAASGSHPDHRLIEPEGDQLKIEQMRDLIREATLSPIEGRYKIFIIRRFDFANTHAANALLKTLEEPSDSTRILLTSGQGALLPTITSRCQVLNLRTLPLPTLAAALCTGWQAPPEQAELLARLSGGRLGWAVQMLAQPANWQARHDRLHALLELTRQRPVERLTFAAGLAKSNNSEETLHDWLLWWRDVLLVQHACDHLIVNLDQRQQLHTLAAATLPGEVRRFIEALIAASQHLRQNVNTQLALEALLLKMPAAT